MSESLPADSGWTESDPPLRETAGKNAAAEEQLAEEGKTEEGERERARDRSVAHSFAEKDSPLTTPCQRGV